MLNNNGFRLLNDNCRCGLLNNNGFRLLNDNCRRRLLNNNGFRLLNDNCRCRLLYNDRSGCRFRVVKTMFRSRKLNALRHVEFLSVSVTCKGFNRGVF